MSKAKSDYYKFKAETDKYHEGFVDVIQNYVDELEKQNKIMLEALMDCLKVIKFQKGIKAVERATGMSIEEALK